ncbi:DUF2637 domain-containing protein [Streptomyces sp. NBC_01410]|uniref:DUF2637 domain-containing protein n=1 Tax=Streptomyces sp. NBC_01410 TaxID=2903856 RepID=UPI00325368AB
MSGYWPRPDDGLGTAPYHYQFPSDALGADVLDPTIPDGLDVHPDTHWDFESDLTQLLKAAAPDPVAPTVSSVPPLPRRRGARRRPSLLVRCVRRIRAPRVKVLSLIIAALTAAIVGMLSVLSGLIAYDPLRRMASPEAHGLAGWWPLLVYGPWLVASLSILRAALHDRRAAHSWAVVVLFSAVAMCLCVAHAPRSPIPMAVAALPPVTALLSFQQLVHQILLTSPCRRASRQRHGGHAAACCSD